MCLFTVADPGSRPPVRRGSAALEHVRGLGMRTSPQFTHDRAVPAPLWPPGEPNRIVRSRAYVSTHAGLHAHLRTRAQTRIHTTHLFPVTVQVAPTLVDLPTTESTLADELRTAGYKTRMIGKWHLGFTEWSMTPNFRGFENWYRVVVFTPVFHMLKQIRLDTFTPPRARAHTQVWLLFRLRWLFQQNVWQ